MGRLFDFPSVVNEKAARAVAGCVLLLSAITLATGFYWLAALMAVGFALRVGWGPRFSPLAKLATRVIAPRLGAEKPVPGPPKRFAQAMGLTFTTGAAAFGLLGLTTVADVLLVFMLIATTLESIFAICLGCEVFGALMRIGLIPERICVECANLAARRT
jgi:Domain of unknown function (DUF4395)